MSEEMNQPEKIHGKVSFGEGNVIAVTGIIGGTAVALGIPWIVLSHSQGLSTALIVTFVVVGLLIGGAVAAASAVLGLVMPREVGGGGPGQINDWIRWGMEWKKWSEKDWKDFAESGDWVEPDYENWSKDDWKAWGQKMKEKYREKKS
jgi:hypothetical protein